MKILNPPILKHIVLCILIIVSYNFSFAAKKKNCVAAASGNQIETLSSEIPQLEKSILSTARKLSDGKIPEDKSISTVKQLIEDSIRLSILLNEIYPNTPSIPMSYHYFYRQFVGGTSGTRTISKKGLKTLKVKIKDGLIYNIKNELLDTQNDKWIFIYYKEELYISTQDRASEFGKVKHATMAMGLPLMLAGEIKVDNGKITYIDNESGRNRHSHIFLMQAVEQMKESGLNADRLSVKGFYRKEPYLSSEDIKRMVESKIKITETYQAQYERGLEIFNEFLDKDYNFSKMSEGKIWNKYDFLLNWGRPDDVHMPKTVTLLVKLLARSFELGLESDFLYELKYLSPFINYRLFVEEINKWVEKSDLNEKQRSKINKFLERTDFIRIVQEEIRV